MKAQIFDIKGEKTGEVTLPVMFDTRVRNDLSQKFYEVMKVYAPYSPAPTAGRRHSASGTISHLRHDWKGHYGKGIARVPRKAMWRRGEQFYWVGAEINQARGGRAVHTPRTHYRPLKINEREQTIAMHSAFAATAHKNYVAQRYARLNKAQITVPVVLNLSGNIKTKQFIELLKKLYGENYLVALQQKTVRNGKGKMRGRTYKNNAGLLLVKSEKEKITLKGVDVVNAMDVTIADLYPLGRLTLYTENSLKELAHA
ncbi:MAG: 50S ribosomal protein L4 [Candidatus Pacearchaeota archaeon]